MANLGLARPRFADRSKPHCREQIVSQRVGQGEYHDLGYMMVTSDYRLEVSPRIREEYSNGREYYALHGNQLDVPLDATQRPSEEYLRWHTEQVFTT